MLELIFQNNTKVELLINENPFGDFIQLAYKHLQHLSIPFDEVTYLPNLVNKRKTVVDNLIDSAKNLHIDIDPTRLNDQQYLNLIHELYEKGYNQGNIKWDNNWMKYHDSIHSIETINSNRHDVCGFLINYKDRAGAFERPFLREYMEHTTTFIPRGSLFLSWMELGKVPMRYWQDKEPNDIKRLCELTKPWLTLRPAIGIALEDYDDFPSQDEFNEFRVWFADYEKQWTDHWKIDKLYDSELASSNLGYGPQGSKIIIGKLSDIDSDVRLILDNLAQDILPQQIRLIN